MKFVTSEEYIKSNFDIDEMVNIVKSDMVSGKTTKIHLYEKVFNYSFKASLKYYNTKDEYDNNLVIITVYGIGGTHSRNDYSHSKCKRFRTYRIYTCGFSDGFIRDSLITLIDEIFSLTDFDKFIIDSNSLDEKTRVYSL